MDSFEEFKGLFPPNSTVQIFEGNTDEYNAVIRTKGTTKDEFKEWLNEYQLLSKTNWRILNTTNVVSVKFVYKARYRCHHNTYPSKTCITPSIKHTGCRALLMVEIRTQVKRNRSMDKLRNSFPTIISINYNHNHKVLEPEALRQLQMSEETKRKFKLFFQHGISPTVAHKMYCQNLIQEYGECASADASICPSIKQVYSFYYSKENKQFVIPRKLRKSKPRKSPAKRCKVDSETSIKHEVPENMIELDEVSYCEPPSPAEFDMSLCTSLMINEEPEEDWQALRYEWLSCFDKITASRSSSMYHALKSALQFFKKSLGSDLEKVLTDLGKIEEREVTVTPKMEDNNC